jgi:hypothetical protein
MDEINDAPSPDAHTGITCWINGDVVAEDSFTWDPAHPIYTDGSCKYVTNTALDVSAVVAVQVLPE